MHESEARLTFTMYIDVAAGRTTIDLLLAREGRIEIEGLLLDNA
jgi:hypothetical protein